MATRLYFTSSADKLVGGPSSSPSGLTDVLTSCPADKWTLKNMHTDMDVGGEVNSYCSTALEKAASPGQHGLYAVFISDAMAAQNILGSQTLKFLFGGKDETHSGVGRWYLYAYIWRSGSGNVKTLYSNYGPIGDELDTTKKFHGSTSLTSEPTLFNALENDRIVVEIWFNRIPGLPDGMGNSNPRLYFGGTEEGTVGNSVGANGAASYFEHAQDITFVSSSFTASESYDYDAGISAIKTKGYDFDAVTCMVPFKSYTFNGYIIKTFEDYNFNSAILGNNTKSYSFSASVARGLPYNFDCSILELGLNKNYTFDINILSAYTKTLNYDAYIVDVGTKNYSFDINILGNNQKQYIYNTNVFNTINKEYIFNSSLIQEITKSYNTNVAIKIDTLQTSYTFSSFVYPKPEIVYFYPSKENIIKIKDAKYDLNNVEIYKYNEDNHLDIILRPYEISPNNGYTALNQEFPVKLKMHLTLLPGKLLSNFITDFDNKPLQDVIVRLYTNDMRQLLFTEKTNRYGVFVMDAKAGDYIIEYEVSSPYFLVRGRG